MLERMRGAEGTRRARSGWLCLAGAAGGECASKGGACMHTAPRFQVITGATLRINVRPLSGAKGFLNVRLFGRWHE